MVHVLREELEIVLNKKQGRHRGLVVGVELVGAYTGHENWKTPWSFLLECAYDYPIFTNIKYDDSLVNDPYRSAAESLGLRHYKRRCFLTHDPCGSKLLRHQTFACLIADGTFVCLGTIHRDTYQLALEPPTIILQIEDQDSVPRTLLQLKAASDVRLVQIDSPLFAFEPVLKALQKMRFLPLSEEILFWENGKKIKRPLVPVPEITCKLTQDPSIDIQLLFDTPRSVNLDSSQVRSLLAGLNQKVSLIQGPPGTGKSFIGALIAKALYKYTKQTILVVCYTNHALDQFLEDLIAIGVEREDIVRFGGRPKTSVEDLSIKNIKRERLLYAESWNELTSVANGYGDKLVKSFEKFISSDTNFSSILSHIKFKDPKFFAAFQVPIPEHGMFTVGPLGKLVDPTFLISRWAQGKSPSLFKDEPNVRDAAHIWNMETCHRQQKLESWRISVTAGIADDIRIAGQRYNRCQANMKSISRGYLPLSGKRIIGCTTTGAAKFTEDINDISPDVLLVEEAGEILESHVITALSSSTTQMILIGDHKQLRPKVNNYALTIEKGDGYDLNRSLFERLILKGFPHVTLSTQHRMRPEISSLIRELTYPDLVDAPGTQNRENIRGVQSNVIFVDHNHPEDDDERIFDRGDGGSPTSKRNTFEVDMVLRMVRYLTHQGYESKNIVVLTPYLGQLSMLRDALKDERDTILNDLDLNALLLHGLWHTDTMKKKDRIQLVTIDNYQGEESDIVIASLCRSNASNDIGFMHSPERLNVLISRARNGLILIGNSSTFERSKKGGTLWSRFFDLLRKGGHFYKGFPVKCEKHPNWMGRVMEKFDDFDISPTGGCTEPWYVSYPSFMLSY
ncbi:P-loop containing nucleoside triphosphate hydrolase protein [Scleroderma citrinum]